MVSSNASEGLHRGRQSLAKAEPLNAAILTVSTHSHTYADHRTVLSGVRQGFQYDTNKWAEYMALKSCSAFSGRSKQG